jgi:hypothetical protein
MDRVHWPNVPTVSWLTWSVASYAHGGPGRFATALTSRR